jgi:hypothetical protein
MKTLFRAVTVALGVAIFATFLTPSASAGCGNTSGQPAPSLRQPSVNLVPVAYRPARFVLVGDHDSDSDMEPIVGMWKFTFISKNNQGIPDGTVIDAGLSQWHSDGTEFLNSGRRAPATQNFCLGVWKKTGRLTYKLNHLGLSYDPAGIPNGSANIREDVIVDSRGNSYTGTFTIDVLDPRGVRVAHLTGEITGERFTAD